MRHNNIIVDNPQHSSEMGREMGTVLHVEFGAYNNYMFFVS